MFKFKEGTSSVQIQNIKEQIDAMPSQIPQIKSFETGTNISQSPKAFDLILVSEFESITALEEYQVHPSHLALIDALGDIREKTHVVDYQV